MLQYPQYKKVTWAENGLLHDRQLQSQDPWRYRHAAHSTCSFARENRFHQQHQSSPSVTTLMWATMKIMLGAPSLRSRNRLMHSARSNTWSLNALGQLPCAMCTETWTGSSAKTKCPPRNAQNAWPTLWQTRLSFKLLTPTRSFQTTSILRR